MNPHIVLVCDLPVPPKKAYGGTERVVAWLAKELIQTDRYRVTLISPAGGSCIPGVDHLHVTCREEALRLIPRAANIVHFHGWLPDDLDSHQNWLMTLHGNEPNPESLPLQCCCISKDHAVRHGRSLFVYNGIDPAEYLFRPTKQDHLLYFSKVRRRVKGAAEAIDLALQCGLDLRICGGTRLDLIKLGALWKSFSPQIKVLGEIDGVQKAREFASASLFLFPIAWEEPFGLVLVESLMSGTPVLARPRGSVSELINRDVGGTYSSMSDFEDELERCRSLSNKACRDYALTYFSSSVMAERYAAIYERIMDNDRAIF